MKRFTEKFKDGRNILRKGIADIFYTWFGRFFEGDAVDKLAEYEDLEERLNAVYGECDGILEKVIEHLERHENVDIPEPVFKARLLTDGEVDRWEEFKTLEEQGKLLKLDFKYQKIMIGQEIFVIEDGVVKPRKICRINEWWNDYHGFQGEYAATPSKGFGSWEFKYEDFGKTVFLTKEEAEAALKELERRNEREKKI